MGIIRFRAVLEYGKFPFIHLSRVREPTYTPNVTIVAPVEIEILAFDARHVIAVFPARFLTVESLNDLFDRFFDVLME